MGAKQIDRDFKRLSPSALREKTALPAGWFVISLRLFQGQTPSEGRRSRRMAHGKWFKISSEHSTIFRIIRFSGSLKSDQDKPAQIILDYVGWLALSGNAEDIRRPRKLEITQAKWHDYPRLIVSHPDPSFRLASWIALLSFALGVLSIALAVMPFLIRK